jgi:hypothetical protein
MTAPELIQTIEAGGGVLILKGDRIRYELPEDAAPMVEVLRQHRAEVFRVLQERDQYAVALEATAPSTPPPMPAGVKLLRWEPKQPPIELTMFSVVTDPQSFIRSTLGQLEAALQGKSWAAGNWSVRDLCERLEQVGIRVDVAPKG